jgi:hypothetical protein
MRTRTGVSLIAVLLLAVACGTRTAPRAEPVAAPVLPWLGDGALHLGDTTLPTPADQVVHAVGTTLVGLAGQSRSRWWLLDRDRLLSVLDEPAYVVPVLSADGGTAAWVAGREATVYDVPTRTVLGRTRLTSPATVVAVANDGRVGLTQGSRSGLLSWRAGDEPAPASWRDFGGHLPDGAVRSPDETRAAGPDLVVRDTRTGERTTLDLATDPRWAVRAWQDDDTVLVAHGDVDTAPVVARCEATTGVCDPD